MRTQDFTREGIHTFTGVVPWIFEKGRIRAWRDGSLPEAEAKREISVQFLMFSRRKFTI